MAELYEEMVPVPRAVQFPVEMRPPADFRGDDPSTWPRVEGRLEYVGGRLLYMPPCGDVQQEVAVDVVYVLRQWADEHPEFVVGGNEAGILFGREARAADAAVWRSADARPTTGRFRRVPPLLAVEVAGSEEDEPALRAKAQWYVAHGVGLVWLVLPGAREVVVIGRGAESRHGSGARLPVHPELPGLEPAVDRFFEQLDR